MAEPDPSCLAALQQRLGHAFKDGSLLQQALTHPSYLQDHPAAPGTNQRLEFLGDAVLHLILSERLYELFPDLREGGLSQRRAALAKGAFLVELAREIGLDGSLRLAASEEASGGRTRASAMEDAFEAVIGAVYLDGGLDAARGVVGRLYGDLPARLAGVEDGQNPKGRLQETIQPAHGNQAIRYEVVATVGADHLREFEVEVYLNDRPLGRGRGSSKKAAEEEAARAALENLAKLG